MAKSLDSKHSRPLPARSSPDFSDFEEILRVSYDDLSGERRAAQRDLLLRCGTFLILREVGAPAEGRDLGVSLGFPGDFGKETDRNETPFFFQPPPGPRRRYAVKWP
jgi:hypothetical protein